MRKTPRFTWGCYLKDFFKEKFKLQDQISFVFLGSKDDGCLVESIDTNQNGRNE